MVPVFSRQTNVKWMKDSWADIYFLCRDEASDHVEVYVENTKETVETTAKLLLYRLDMIISLHKETETKSPLLGSGSLPTTFPSPWDEKGHPVSFDAILGLVDIFLVSELAPFSASDFEMALLQSIYFAKISRLKSSPHLQPLSKSLLRHQSSGEASTSRHDSSRGASLLGIKREDGLGIRSLHCQ